MSLLIVGIAGAILLLVIVLGLNFAVSNRRSSSGEAGPGQRRRRSGPGRILLIGSVAGILIGLMAGTFLWFGTEPERDPGPDNLTPTVAQSQVMPTMTVEPPEPDGDGPPTIHDISTNLAEVADSSLPRFAKLEISFQVDTIAQNLQFPYDASPPAGIQPEIGVSVDALFTPDDWETIFYQPAFYYQAFQDEDRNGRRWLYPTHNFSWKVRFTPHQLGRWQFKLVAKDAGGIYESDALSFQVVESTSKGFIRVSQADPRYFEYEDGAYFPALGLNFNIPAREESYRTMADNGIQLIRTWIPSQLSIFGSAWSPPLAYGAAPLAPETNTRLRHDAAPPFNLTPGVDPPLARAGSELFLWLSHDETVAKDGNQWNFVPCAVWGWLSPHLPVKRETDYRIRVRYRSQDLAGPKVKGQPFGFAIKTGGWLWDSNDERRRCYYPGTGRLLAADYGTGDTWSTYADPDYDGWQILEGHFNSGNTDFLDNLYLVIENATSGHILVDYIWLQEELGNGQVGPNVITKPWMAFHQYFDQGGSYLFDRTLEMAERQNIYLKVVVLEKNDYVFNIFEPDGTLSAQPPSQHSPPLFFGNGRETEGKTKVRWLQQAWWRYLQARWGYSPHIHSWELLNEGDPFSVAHYILADELGKYFKESFIPPDQQSKHPNTHLVTTSFWNSFPLRFWQHEDIRNVDYADVHHYARESNTRPLDYIYEINDFYDAALFSQKLSLVHGSKQPEGPGKPVIRGETGFIFDNKQDIFSQNITNGVWLHNFIWAGINSGGLIESYWTGSPIQNQIYKEGSHDHRPIYRSYYNFISTVPLSNGHYQEASAQVTEPDLRVWGQKDLVNGQAHLWIQNKNHTWKNLYDGRPIPPVSGTVTLSGFQPDQTYLFEWWDTYQPDPEQQLLRQEEVVAGADGSLIFPVDNLETDIAVKILSPEP